MEGSQRRPDAQLNVLGEPLTSCSHDPLTGFFRDGCCNTGPLDQGMHTVCAIVTDEFLEFSRRRVMICRHRARNLALSD